MSVCSISNNAGVQHVAGLPLTTTDIDGIARIKRFNLSTKSYTLNIQTLIVIHVGYHTSTDIGLPNGLHCRLQPKWKLKFKERVLLIQPSVFFVNTEDFI